MKLPLLLLLDLKNWENIPSELKKLTIQTVPLN